MTAYVVISLLEADFVPFDPRIESAAKCIKESLNDVTDSYSLSIISYMFSKMKKTEDYEMVMKKLNDMAIDEGSDILFVAKLLLVRLDRLKKWYKLNPCQALGISRKRYGKRG